tara:strand:+ start:596 stop:1207 length:612 start_codon:yes stop_codon:yes gene_type:complete
MKAINILLLSTLGFFVFDIKVNSQTAQFMPEAMIAEPGEQKTNNLSTGSSASLRVSTSSSFGANANVSASEGLDIISESTLDIKEGNFSSGFGTTGPNPGIISVNVENVRSSGTGLYQSDGLQLDSDDTLSAEATSEVQGIYSEAGLKLEPTSITYTKISPKEDHENKNTMETANGNAGKNMSNSLNVDITNNNFTNAFSQAF